MKKLRISLCLLLCLALALAFTACGESEKPAETTLTSQDAETEQAATEELDEDELPIMTDGEQPKETEHELHHVQIVIRDYGTVSLELDATAAPITVQNFLDLASSGFYDGLTFHRIMDGFMIQGGDPLGNGTGGSSETIPGEFLQNGVDNPISHVKGVISMARSSSPNSASSQFFITVADATFLDGAYAAFGHVTEGMEIAEQLARDARPIDNNGTIPASEQPVIESIVITD